MMFITKDFLIEKYINERKTCKEIADLIPCNHMFIYRKLKTFGIPIRNHGEALRGKKFNRSLKQNQQIKELHKLPKTKKQLLACSKNGKKSYKVNLKKATEIASKLPRTEKQLQASAAVGRIVGKIICSRRGSNAIHWKGGITPIHVAIRNLPESKNWVQSVFRQDAYTCQDCKKQGEYLEAHHLKPFSIILKEFLQLYSQFSPIEDKETLVRLAVTYSEFWNVHNGRSLCFDCHKDLRKVTK